MLKREHFKQYYLLMRMDKPIGTWLLMWPTLWAIWIASQGKPDLLVLFVFCSGVFLMRSAGCVINDFADREVDKYVERTQHRPLTSGQITSREALSLFALLSLTAFALVLTMNWLTVQLSFIALLLASVYPFMKRYTHFPQVVLGMAFSWAIPMAFAAQNNVIDPIAWQLYFFTILWIVAYDTMYAMVDRDDDLKIGIKSTAIIFAQADLFIIGFLQLSTLLGLIAIGWQLGLGFFYYLGLMVAAGLAVYQQWLIKDRHKPLCFKAFLNNHWFGMAIFVGILLDFAMH